MLYLLRFSLLVGLFVILLYKFIAIGSFWWFICYQYYINSFNEVGTVLAVLEICDKKNNWQWSQIEIKLNDFYQSANPHRQFTIISIKIITEMERFSVTWGATQHTPQTFFVKSWLLYLCLKKPYHQTEASKT